MLCPACRTDLTMSERSGIEIDYCPSCRGVWLDRGELDKIIERSGESSAREQPRSSRPWPEESYNDRHGYPPHRHKRRKSFLEQIFD